MTPAPLCAAVEVALNRTLRLEPEVLADFARLKGNTLALHVETLGWSFFVECLADGVRVSPTPDTPPQAELAGTPLALGRFASQAARGHFELPPGVRLGGNPILFKDFADILQRIDFRPTELAAHWIGEGAAHRLGHTLQGLLGWGRRSAATLTAQGAEYLREETRDLARRIDAQEWMDAVDTLRSDTAQLDVRVRRLEAARSGARP